MEQLKIGEVILSKQIENSENYQRFKKIVAKKHIQVNTIDKGETLKIEKDLYFYCIFGYKFDRYSAV